MQQQKRMATNTRSLELVIRRCQLVLVDSDSDSSMEASRNTDEHCSPGRANKLEGSPHLTAPVTENHKARPHGGLVHSVITPTSATTAPTLPINSHSDFGCADTPTKKTPQQRRCKNNPHSAHPDFSSKSRITRIG